MIKEFISFYGKNILLESTLVNGVKEFSNLVQKRKYINGCLYKQTLNIWLIDLLKKIGIYDYFEYVAGSDTFEYCKPDPRHLNNYY